MAYDFDLVVIGGGAAGLTPTGIAPNAGVKTLLVEEQRLGGDCTWTGCVPSKTLLAAAHVAHVVRDAARFGIGAPAPEVDFPAVMRHVRALREHVYRDADAPEIYEAFGAEVVQARAQFVNDHAVELTPPDGPARRVTGRLFVVATGGRPAVPPIPGLDAVPFLTSRTLFEIEARPRHLAVLGAGPIGVEMAQAFRRLGADVTVVDRGERILSRDDPGHAATLQGVLEGEGVRFVLGASVARVTRTGAGQAGAETELHVERDGRTETIICDALLVATGRKPNVEGLGLDAAGVETSDKGIVVNEHCRTNQKHVFAAGDCTGEYHLTHQSEHMAKVAATNAVLRLPMRLDRQHVPWATYTDPELAHLGASEQELQAKGQRYEVYRFPYARLDRAITDGATTGEVRVFATGLAGTILGASVLGARAGELISTYAVAMRNGVSLKNIADTIHPYPTYGLGARRAADQWYVQKQSPTAVRLLQKLLGYRGPVPPPPDPDRLV